MRILFDKNVPLGVRSFLSGHEVRTFVEMGWHPQLENGELLKAGEAAGFDVMVTSDQNIKYQQNLTGRKIALVVLGSNIWPIVRGHGETITEKVNAATPGSYDLLKCRYLPSAEETKIKQGRELSYSLRHDASRWAGTIPACDRRHHSSVGGISGLH